MTAPISRQALEVAVDRLHARELIEGARAILNGEPLEWCVEHDSAFPQPKGEPWRCHWAAWREQASIFFDKDGERNVVVLDDCRFESYIRVQVGP